MSKKKLLNERTIRRFGGLAGIKPATTSNFLGEMGMEVPYERDDEEGLEIEDEEVEMDIEEEPVEDELAIEEPAPEGDAEGLVVSLLDKVKEWASEQGVEMDVEDDGGEEMDMELGGEEEVDLGGEEEVDLEVGDEEELALEEGDKPWGEKKGDKSDTDEEDKDYVGKDNPKESVQLVDDEKVIQEVTKRVKNRLRRIAKAQKRRR